MNNTPGSQSRQGQVGQGQGQGHQAGNRLRKVSTVTVVGEGILGGWGPGGRGDRGAHVLVSPQGRCGEEQTHIVKQRLSQVAAGSWGGVCFVCVFLMIFLLSRSYVQNTTTQLLLVYVKRQCVIAAISHTITSISYCVRDWESLPGTQGKQ